MAVTRQSWMDEEPVDSDGPFAAAELIAVGDQFCLHRFDLGLTAMLNVEGARAWRDLAAEHARGRFPEADTFCDGLQEAGFLAPVVEVPREPRRIAPKLSGEFQSVFEVEPVNGRRIAIACDDLQLYELLQATLISSTRQSSSTPTAVISAIVQPDGYSVQRDGTVIASGCDLSLARRAVVQSAMLAARPSPETSAILHGSTIGIDGAGVLLAGETGAGKTTLMLHALTLGASYVADDFSALDGSGVLISPFPVRVSIKAPLWEWWAQAFPALGQCQRFEIAGREVRYLDPRSDADTASAPLPVRLIVFPSYGAGTDTLLRRLSAAESFGRLLMSGSEIVGANRSLANIARFATCVPAIEVRYSDLDAVWSVINTQLAAAP